MDFDRETFSRRSLLLATAAAGYVPEMMAQSPGGGGSNNQVPLPPFMAQTERQSNTAPLPDPPERRVGFAVVGLGRLALEEVLPAFGECKHAKLTALVSGDASKARQVAEHHGVKSTHIYDYRSYDRLRENPDVDVIYIILPNSMHPEYTVRGAEAGKHILCEKPMATNPRECEQMIAACQKANRKLMIAYRMQYEPYNQAMIKLVRQKELGQVRLIEAANTQNQGEPNQWRLKRALAGGGALPDIGIYCLNATRYLTGEEPEEVFAQIHSTPNDPRFREVEETINFQLRYPSGILASCLSSYGAHEGKRYRVYAERGWAEMDPAFSYRGLRMKVTQKQDDQTEGAAEHRKKEKNQFALEMDHMAQCVRDNKPVHTPGEEGLQDHRIMAALYESAKSGKPVKMPAVQKQDAFRGPAPVS